jgi:hypothetical protein
MRVPGREDGAVPVGMCAAEGSIFVATSTREVHKLVPSTIDNVIKVDHLLGRLATEEEVLPCASYLYARRSVALHGRKLAFTMSLCCQEACSYTRAVCELCVMPRVLKRRQHHCIVR